MAEFVTFDPNVEVNGQVILTAIAVLGDQALPTLSKYGLDDIQADGWYPIQTYLDAFHEISTQSYFNMVSIGMNIPDVAMFPPLETLDDALASLGEAYHMNHRGGKIGEYTFTRTGDRSGEMYCRNPYPSDFDYGIIYRLVQKFRPSDSVQFMVKRDDSVPNRKNGADACTYYIEW